MKRLIISLFILDFFFRSFSFAQVIKPPEYMSQGNFAILLARAMGMEGLFRAGALPQEYINLLEKFGISPLEGFQADKVLTKGELATILVRALGWEGEIFTRMRQCNRNLLVIMSAWASQNEEDGYRMNLEELLRDHRFFPDGPPICPWGYKYMPLDKDRIVDVHIHNDAKAYMALLAEEKIMELALAEEPVTVAEAMDILERIVEAKAFVPIEKIKGIYIVPASPLQK